MFSQLRRWLSSGARGAAANEVEPWAQALGLQFRRVREGAGFVIEGGGVPDSAGTSDGLPAWRGEWGASSRAYIPGNELRLFCELDLTRDVQALVIDRPLADVLEKMVFEQFVEGVQTRIDTEVPPEARWLVMFPKLSGSEMRGLREQWVALSTVKPWLLRWLAGPLSDALQGMATRLPAGTPVVLTISRGRLALRTALEDPGVQALGDWLAFFEVAVHEARRVIEEMPDAAPTRPGALPTSWGGGTEPGEFGSR